MENKKMPITKHRIPVVISLAAATLLAARPAFADVVHADDVIITGNLCAGSADCASGRSFVGDLEVTGEPPEIILFDTRAGADDWQLEANSDDLIIRNRVDGGPIRNVARLSGGAPANSLFVDSDGNIGLGTSTPSTDLHLAASSPTIRFQDTDDEQFWDIVASNLSFRVFNASTGIIPLLVKPGGDVGIGSTAPFAALHLRRANGTAKLLVEEASAAQASRTLFQLQNNGEPKFGFKNTAFPQSWEFFASVGFAVNEISNPGLEFVLGPTGNLAITGSLTTGGPSCGGGCDAVFSPGFEIEPIEEHAAKMWEQSHLPAVGPTSPSESLNVSDKIGGLINELEKAHIYIERLNEETKRQRAGFEAASAEKDRRLAELEQRVAEIAALVRRSAASEASVVAGQGVSN
jgi:hypothetical protein